VVGLLDSSGHIGGWLEAKKAMDTLRYDVDTSDMLEGTMPSRAAKIVDTSERRIKRRHERLRRTRAANVEHERHVDMPNTSGNADMPNTSGNAEHERQ